VATEGTQLHYEFVNDIAKAYSLPGGALYHSAAALDAIQRGLTFGAQYYCPTSACM
jgi:hypothetical protein